MTDMETRTVKDAVNLETGEKIYFTGHAQATYMSDGRTVEDAISQSSGNGGGDNIYADLDITKERFAELLERDFYCPLMPEAPTEETFFYTDTDGSEHGFSIGQECRVPVEESSEYVFYKYMGEFNGKAVWMEVSHAISAPEEEAYTDLSRQNIYGQSIAQTTANCYVVKEIGNYMFPIAYGAAIKNGNANPKAYTRVEGIDTGYFVNYKDEFISTPYVEEDTGSKVSSIELRICDEPGLMDRLKIKNLNGKSYAAFTLNKVPATGANAILSVLDDSGIVMWSWHIWVWPDDLSVETITNATGVEYKILPVNLGSKWDNESKDHIKNWYYQWGRPTPVLGPSAYNSSSTAANYGQKDFVIEDNPASSYGTALHYPETFFKNGKSPYQWAGSRFYYNLWDAQNTSTGNSDVQVVKTVYDPSPVGFCIPNGNVFTGFSISNVIGEFNSGWKFKRNSADDDGLFFPASGHRRGSNGQINTVALFGYIWLSSVKDTANVYEFIFGEVTVEPQSAYSCAGGYSIRPVSEEASGNTKKTVIRINQGISDPETMITRIVDEGGIEAIRSNSHRYTGVVNSAGVMELKQLNDADGTKYIDGTDAELTTIGVDVWMKLPQFYWKCVNKSEVEIDIFFAYGERPKDTGWKIWDGKDLIGVYEGFVENEKLYSISGKTPGNAGNYYYISREANNRGSGYSLCRWKHHCMMAALFYAQYNHTNSQAIVGEGLTGNTSLTGKSNLLGMEDTVHGENGESQTINFWGLETWWGNRSEWLHDVKSVNYNVVEIQDDGSEREVGTVVSSSGFISKMKFGEHLDLLPIEVNASGTSGFCDKCFVESGTKNILRSYYGKNTDAGCAYFSSSGLSSATVATGRIAYRGDYVVIL